MSLCIFSREHIVDTLVKRAGDSVLPDVYADWLWNLSDEALITEYKVAMGLGEEDEVYLSFDEYLEEERARRLRTRRRQIGFMRDLFEGGYEYDEDISQDAANALAARQPPRARCPRARTYLLATGGESTGDEQAVFN